MTQMTQGRGSVIGSLAISKLRLASLGAAVLLAPGLTATGIIGPSQASAAATARPAAAAVSPETQLRQALRQLVAMPDGPPGVVVVVQRGARRTVYTAGVADLATRRPINVTDRMRLASASKAYSGAVALAIVSCGVLRLNATIGKLLPWLPRAWARVTLRELLQHTSGLPDFSANPAFQQRVQKAPRKPIAPRQLLEFVAHEGLLFTPGSRFMYDNSDNVAVALMAEAATGRSYNTLLRTLVFRPLRLVSTSLPVGFRLPQPYIHGYDVTQGKAEDVSTVFSASLAWASGGMVSTPAELNSFIRAYTSTRLFSRGAQAQQLRFVPGSSEPPGPGTNSAGLAIFRYATRCGTVYGHTGNILGYTQFAAATLGGRNSVTVSASEQLSPGLRPKIFAALRHAEELAVCVALTAGR